MTGLYSMFKTNSKDEREGVWLEYGRTPKTDQDPEGLPIRIKIARAGGKNTDFNKALEKATKPHRKAIQTGHISVETVEALYREVFVDHCIVGWENVAGAAGEMLPYTRPNVLRVLTDLPDLYEDLKGQANSLGLYREEEREADLGNSGRSLSTDGSKDL